jgi:glycerol dehydrogenase
LLEDGYKAMLAVEQGVVTPSLENIVEANIYLRELVLKAEDWRLPIPYIMVSPRLRPVVGCIMAKKWLFGTITQLIRKTQFYPRLEAPRILSP